MAKDGNPSYSAGTLPKLITFRLSRLQARANAQAFRVLKKHAGISLSEWRIFVMIEANGKISPAQIGRLTGFDKGLISRTIKGMQEKGLLHIEASEADQRSHMIDFTSDGRALFERARPAMLRRQAMLHEAFDQVELDALFRAFDKLDQTLEEMDDRL